MKTSKIFQVRIPYNKKITIQNNFLLQGNILTDNLKILIEDTAINVKYYWSFKSMNQPLNTFLTKFMETQKAQRYEILSNALSNNNSVNTEMLFSIHNSGPITVTYNR